MKLIATIFTVILATLTTVGFSQETTGYVAKYRVIAVNGGDQEIVSTSNTAEVVPDIFLYVPNAFTPNGDGLNDEFGALGYGVKEYYLAVYNRWGELIFTSDNVDNQWDGTYQGTKVLPGTYVYNISASGHYDKEFHKEGTISIVKI